MGSGSVRSSQQTVSDYTLRPRFPNIQQSRFLTAYAVGASKNEFHLPFLRKSFVFDDVKLAELSNNSFEWKNVTFLWGQTYVDLSYIFSGDQDPQHPINQSINQSGKLISRNREKWLRLDLRNTKLLARNLFRAIAQKFCPQRPLRDVGLTCETRAPPYLYACNRVDTEVLHPSCTSGVVSLHNGVNIIVQNTTMILFFIALSRRGCRMQRVNSVCVRLRRRVLPSVENVIRCRRGFRGVKVYILPRKTQTAKMRANKVDLT